MTNTVLGIAGLVSSLLLAGVQGERAIIRREAVGPITLGMSAAEIAKATPADRRKEVQLYLGEGETARGIEVTLPTIGEPCGVVAELHQHPAGEEVARIWVRATGCRTEKGIGVGSTVGQLRAAYRIAWVGFGEGRLYMRVEELGASFELDLRRPDAQQLEGATDPEKIPADVKVVAVLLTGAG